MMKGPPMIYIESEHMAQIKSRAETLVNHVNNRGGAVLKNGIWNTMVEVGGTDVPALIEENARLNTEIATLRKTTKG
jgi:hypothetical protein